MNDIGVWSNEGRILVRNVELNVMLFRSSYYNVTDKYYLVDPSDTVVHSVVEFAYKWKSVQWILVSDGSH